MITDIASLAVGNWVYCQQNGKPEKIAAILENGMVMLDYNDVYSLDEIDGLPILGKQFADAGFKHTNYIEGHMRKRDVAHTAYSLLLENGAVVATVDFANGIFNEIELFGNCHVVARGREIRYFHQIQNAFSLCGIKIEFKL